MRYTLLILFLYSQLLDAQNTLYRIAKLPFIKQGKVLQIPFSKGVCNPQFSEIDMNRDGKKDLFVFERLTDNISIFLKTNDTGTKMYQYAPKYSEQFPSGLYNWVMLRDYNCDGMEDIFTFTPGGIRVFKAILQNNEINFVKVSDLLFAKNYDNWPGDVNIWSAYDDMPAIADVDNDGDLDILSIMLGENALSMYKNVRIDSGWSCDSLRFKYQARCWGKFAMLFSNFDIIENACGGDTIDKSPIPNNQSKLRDGGNTFWVFDEEKDGDMEILAGDVAFNNAIYGKNIGSAKMAKMAQKSTTFPMYSTAINEKFPMGFFLDVDNDGNKDMLVNSHSYKYDGYPKKIHFYKNIPSGDTSKFIYQRDNFLMDLMVDKGRLSKPVLFNYNNDSLMDLLIGNDYYCDTFGKCAATLTLYKNIGDKKHPKYEWVTDDYANLKKYSLQQLHVTTGDLTGDGLEDLMLGDAYGKLYFMKQVTDINGWATFPVLDTNTNNKRLGYYIAPLLVDMNGDSLLDLVVGKEEYQVLYIKNIGTKTNAVFDYANKNDSLGRIDTRKIGDIEYPKNKPYYYYDDSLKQSFLYISTLEGKAFIYKINKDSLSKGSFELVNGNFLGGVYNEEISMAIGDINQDKKADFFVGNKTGGLQLFSFGVFDSEVDTVKKPTQIEWIHDITYQVYPNPTLERLNIVIDALDAATIDKIVITDITGKQVFQAPGGKKQYSIQTDEWMEGIYIVSCLKDNRLIGHASRVLKIR